MALTGRLGISDSQLGNILLGSGGVTNLSVAFHGTSSVSANTKARLVLNVEFDGDSELLLESLEFFYVLSAEFLPSSSIVLVDFSSAFNVDSVLLDLASYTITGPSSVTLLGVFTAGPKIIALHVAGTISGIYTVDVVGVVHSSSMGLLKPGHTSATFLAEIPYAARSVFINKGPIAKPETIVQSGNQWSVQTTPVRFFGNVTTSEVVLPGATLNSSHVGLYLRLKADEDLVVGVLHTNSNTNRLSVLSLIEDNPYRVFLGGNGIWGPFQTIQVPSDADFTNPLVLARDTVEVSIATGNMNWNTLDLTAYEWQTVLLKQVDPVNGGDYRILSVINPTRVKVAASFRAPITDPDNNDPDNEWAVIDPNTGFIANDPDDVMVLVNGSQVSIDQVIGLLGQVVLTNPPPHGATISVDYASINDPTVEFRRLNSPEFVSNRWNRDPGVNGKRVFPYRNAIQSTNGAHSRILLDDIRAPQPQPLLREVFYRAYERAYTALSNDPTSLLLNTPKNRVAFPPLSRQISQVSVAYDANTLPESDPTTPWDRKGTGTASVSGGLLTVISNTTGPFPDGQPFYWSRGVDLTFPHAYATTWRLAITATVPDGVSPGSVRVGQTAFEQWS